MEERSRGVAGGQEGEGEGRSREVKIGVCGNSWPEDQGRFLEHGEEGTGGERREAEGTLTEGQEDETAMEEVGINAEVRGRGWSCG